MIVKSKLNISFKQNVGSCVLSSYAIVSNYFTNFPIEQFFEDYCRHFGVSFKSWQEAEYRYAEHFHNEWNKRNCKGYEVILDLHENSKQQAFIESRKFFSANFYLDTAPFVADLENQLKSEESFLNISYAVIGACHSVTFFHDGEHLCLRDTNTTVLNTISTIAQIGFLRDSVLYKKIKMTKVD